MPADLTDDQILERLLALYIERAEAEGATGAIAKRGTRAEHDVEML